MNRGKALACVIGGMDLVRPLGLAGIRCAVVAKPGSPALYSRFTQVALRWDHSAENMDKLVEALISFGTAQLERPVLFYETDAHLLLVSQYRERLAQAFRFVVADSLLVQNLVDKARFYALAERLQLQVPKTRWISPVEGSKFTDIDLFFPVIIKPVTRRESWRAIGGSYKAFQVDNPKMLKELWSRLAAASIDFVVQEIIPGPESQIESYHVYVDPQGNIAGEFAGKKIRTYPSHFGYSTALVITDHEDVMTLGRNLTYKLNLRGVAKFDFKRSPDGKLYLLEVNPRFNLWHHLGAVAGVNLPALVYADMVGLPRPIVERARAGVCWCHIGKDLIAAKACSIPPLAWLRWALRCKAKWVFAWDDPLPFLRLTMSRDFRNKWRLLDPA